MPKIFGLQLRDIIATPAHLKLDADPIKLPKTSTHSSRGRAMSDKKSQSIKSDGCIKRMVRLVRPKSSTSNTDRAEERRRIIDQRIRDLSMLLEASDTSTATRRETDVDDEEHSRGYRRRKALSSLGFGRPATSPVSQVSE